ncbi:MAG: tetratricopeptide repeat protein [Cyanobacteria bacterium P01_E01_bin.35]
MSEILNCGRAKQESELVRFSYQCPKQWNNLQVTANESVRFCDVCQENVFYCTDKQEADQHARQGHCIAIASQLSSDVYNRFTPMVVGRPDTIGLWAKDIYNRTKHGLVEVIRNRVMEVIDLKHSDLSHVDLRGADLSSANLTHANLSQANLQGANLSNANLGHANLREANLTQANLSNANLSNAKLNSADLSNANLSGVDLNYILSATLKDNYYLSFQSINLDGAIIDRQYQAAYLNYKGQFYSRLHNRQEAQSNFQQALLISKETGNPSQTALAYSELAKIYLLEDQAQALVYSQQALSIINEISDRLESAAILVDLGRFYLQQGEPQQSIEFYQRALSIKQELGDRFGSGQIIHQLGNICLKQENQQQALSYFQQAVAIFEQLHNRGEANRNLRSAIKICEDLGNKKYLLAAYYQKLLSTSANDVKILHKLNQIYTELGDEKQTLKYLQLRVSILEKSLNPQELIYRGAEIYVLKIIISIYESLKNYQSSLRYYQELLSIRRQEVNEIAEVESFHQLAISQVHLKQAAGQSTIEYYQELLDFRRRIGDPPGEAQNLLDLGTLYLQQGAKPTAVDYYQQGLAAIRQLIKQLDQNNRNRFYPLQDLALEKQRILELIDNFDYSSDKLLNLSSYCQQLIHNRAENRLAANKILSRITEIKAEL